MALTKKHLEAFAAALKSERPDHAPCTSDDRHEAHTMQWQADCETVADVCARFNHGFDRARFLRACGVEPHRKECVKASEQGAEVCICGSLEDGGGGIVYCGIDGENLATGQETQNLKGAWIPVCDACARDARKYGNKTRRVK